MCGQGTFIRSTCPRSIKWLLPRFYSWHHVRDVAYQALSSFSACNIERSGEGLGDEASLSANTMQAKKIKITLTLHWSHKNCNFLSLNESPVSIGNVCIPYSRKYWRGHKFGGLAVGEATIKLKSANISYTRIYVWRYRTEPQNLNLPIFLFRLLKIKPPNLKTANISGYTVYD